MVSRFYGTSMIESFGSKSIVTNKVERSIDYSRSMLGWLPKSQNQRSILSKLLQCKMLLFSSIFHAIMRIITFMNAINAFRGETQLTK